MQKTILADQIAFRHALQPGLLRSRALVSLDASEDLAVVISLNKNPALVLNRPVGLIEPLLKAGLANSM